MFLFYGSDRLAIDQGKVNNGRPQSAVLTPFRILYFGGHVYTSVHIWVLEPIRTEVYGWLQACPSFGFFAKCVVAVIGVSFF